MKSSLKEEIILKPDLIEGLLTLAAVCLFLLATTSFSVPAFGVAGESAGARTTVDSAADVGAVGQTRTDGSDTAGEPPAPAAARDRAYAENFVFYAP